MVECILFWNCLIWLASQILTCHLLFKIALFCLNPSPVLFRCLPPPLQILPSIHYPAGASGAPSQPEVVVGQMAVRVVADKPWGGRHLLMEDKWDKTRMRNGSQTRGGRGINRNKWRGGKTWKYIMLFFCFVLFSMTSSCKGETKGKRPAGWHS